MPISVTVWGAPGSGIFSLTSGAVGRLRANLAEIIMSTSGFREMKREEISVRFPDELQPPETGRIKAEVSLVGSSQNTEGIRDDLSERISIALREAFRKEAIEVLVENRPAIRGRGYWELPAQK